MSVCMQCEKTLTFNEVGVYKKFISRNAKQFLCKDCLAEKLKISPEFIDKKIEQFKLQGCSLFI